MTLQTTIGSESFSICVTDDLIFDADKREVEATVETETRTLWISARAPVLKRLQLAVEQLEWLYKIKFDSCPKRREVMARFLDSLAGQGGVDELIALPPSPSL